MGKTMNILSTPGWIKANFAWENPKKLSATIHQETLYIYISYKNMQFTFANWQKKMIDNIFAGYKSGT